MSRQEALPNHSPDENDDVCRHFFFFPVVLARGCPICPVSWLDLRLRDNTRASDSFCALSNPLLLLKELFGPSPLDRLSSLLFAFYARRPEGHAASLEKTPSSPLAEVSFLFLPTPAEWPPFPDRLMERFDKSCRDRSLPPTGPPCMSGLLIIQRRHIVYLVQFLRP